MIYKELRNAVNLRNEIKVEVEVEVEVEVTVGPEVQVVDAERTNGPFFYQKKNKTALLQQLKMLQQNTKL